MKLKKLLSGALAAVMLTGSIAIPEGQKLFNFGSIEAKAETTLTIATTLEEMQSDHDYASNEDHTWQYTLSGASYVKFTFSEETRTESGYDRIYIYDGNDALIDEFSGTELAGRTIGVQGSTFKIRLTSDYSSQYYGFSLTSIAAGTEADLYVKLTGTTTCTDVSQLKSPHNAPSGMSRTWEYTIEDAECIEITFSTETNLADDDYIYIYDRNTSKTYYGDNLSGKTLTLAGDTVKIKLYTYGSDSYGFDVTEAKVGNPDNILSGTVYCTSVSQLKSAHNAPAGMSKTWKYELTGAEYVEFTFSEATSLSDSDYIYIYGRDGSKTFSGDQLSGKTLTFKGDTVEITLHTYGSESYGFDVTEVKVGDPNNTLLGTVECTAVSELKSPHNAPFGLEKTWKYKLQGAGCVEFTFSAETKLDGQDYISIYDDENYSKNYSGTELSGKTVTFYGDTVKIELVTYDNKSYGFDVTQVKVGNPDNAIILGNARVFNEYIKITANTSGSTYTLWTTGGDPATTLDDNKKLLYNGTSKTTIRIDGVDSTYSSNQGVQTSNAQKAITSSNTYSGVEVTQRLEILNNIATNRSDVAKFSYTYKNTSSVAKTVGCRIMMDTMLGDNDHAPFRIPGIGNVTTRTELVGEDIPQYWQAFDNLTNPSVIAQGSFLRDASNLPDKVQFTSWPQATGNTWDEIDIGENNGDSAVSVFWDNRVLRPGQSITFSTYYGLSDLAQNLTPPLALSVYGDYFAAQVDYDIDEGKPVYGEMVYTAYINNIGNADVINARVSIELPEGFALAEGETAEKTFEVVAVDEIQQISWILVVDPDIVTPTESYSIKITSGADNDETKEITRTVTIPETLTAIANIEDVEATKSADLLYYTGSVIEPEFVLEYNGFELIKNSNYTVEYSDNVNAGTATVTFTGIGMYRGTKTVEFTIERKEILTDDMTISPLSREYAFGEELTVDVAVVQGDITLVEDVDYEVSYENNINAGVATVTVTGIGNYTGIVSKLFNVDKKSINDAAFTINPTSYTYDGTAKEPAVDVKIGEVTLVKDTDYEVAYESNTNAGTASVTVTGIGNFKDTLSKTFTIEKKSINGAELTLDPTTFVYDRTAKTPAITLVDGAKKLTKDTDYTVSLTNNTNVGTVTVTVTGTGNYKDALTKTFTITAKSIAGMTATLSETNYIYDGTACKPIVTLKDGTATLVNGTDYTVAYTNNTKAGTATVKITGKGNYTGMLTKTFTITAKSVAKLKATLSSSSYNFDNTAKKPTVTVKDGTTTLKSGTDYTVTYTNNTKAGTATATVTGKGNYTGTLKATFTIKKAAQTISVSKTSISKTYGNAAFSLGAKLSKGDSKLTYKSDNTKVATVSNTGKVTIKGAGKAVITIKAAATTNYSEATKTVTISVAPKKATVSSVTTPKTKSVKAVWKKDTTASGYDIEVSTSSKFTSGVKSYTAGKSSTTKTFTGLTKNKTYYVRVRAYVTVNGKKVAGDWATAKSVKCK